MKLKRFEHLNPSSVDEAVSALESYEGKAYVNAGGTDLVGVLRFKILPHYPEAVVNLKSISPSMDYIKEEGGVLKIGALTRLEDIATSSVVKEKYTALAEAAHRTASPHIREMGTIGGNICQHNRCWYYWKKDNYFSCLRKDPSGLCYAMLGQNKYHSIFGAASGCIAPNPSDTAPALMVLNATVVTSARSIPIGEFFTVITNPTGTAGSTVLEADEIVTEIQIPAPAGGVKSAFVKFALRKSIDFPVVNCAAAIGGGEARICMNAVAPTPRRATAAEESIKGKTIDEASADAAAAEAIKGSTALAHNKWKVQIARAMVKRAILACK